MKPSIELIEVLKPLLWLNGIWEGEGKASFPTHDDFRYENNMRFRIIKDAFEDEPIIHFEEMAWTIEKEEKVFKHWETGYFKPDGNNQIQLYISHNTGRIEITYGKYKKLDKEAKIFEIEFVSESIRNDEGTKVALTSRRELAYSDGILKYTLDMSTTEVTISTPHLRAMLYKVDTKP